MDLSHRITGGVKTLFVQSDCLFALRARRGLKGLPQEKSLEIGTPAIPSFMQSRETTVFKP